MLDRVAVPAAAAVFLGLGAHARERRVGPGEERVFRLINGLPAMLGPPLWPVMQAGSLASVFVTAGWLHRRGDDRAATAALAAGAAVWAFAKGVKPSIGRGRPAAHLARTRVIGREQSGLGYPSGHAAVAATLAVVVAASDRRLLAPAAGLAMMVAAARVHAGAHLPLDVVGGGALGLAAGLMARRALPRR